MKSSFPGASNSGFTPTPTRLNERQFGQVHRCEGFTMIEVVIAMILLATGLLALLSVTMGGMAQREVSREYDVARNAASAKLDEIRARDFSSVAAYNNTFFEVDGLMTPTGWANPGNVTIDNSVSDLYDVTVTIRWRIKGNASALVFNEYITRSLMTRRTKY